MSIEIDKETLENILIIITVSETYHFIFEEEDLLLEKYLDLKTNKIYSIPAEGRVTGCGCRLNAKARLATSNCPLNKW